MDLSGMSIGTPRAKNIWKQDRSIVFAFIKASFKIFMYNNFRKDELYKIKKIEKEKKLMKIQFYGDVQIAQLNPKWFIF